MHDLPALCADALTAVRGTSPLVGCITNSVVTNFTANALLATGAAPAMVDIVGESGVFAGFANGLLINLGTPTPEQRAASIEMADAAVAAGTPWVLDPVAIGALPVRTALARELVAKRPTVVRGNSSEIITLSGADGGGRGTDASASVDDAVEAARSLARDHGCVVAVSGAADAICDAERVVRVGGGSEMLTRITGGGCALGAIVAAFAGATSDPFVAAVAAHSFYSAAAELAATRANGPGSFMIAFLDALAQVTPAHLAASESIEE